MYVVFKTNSNSYFNKISLSIQEYSLNLFPQMNTLTKIQVD